MIEYLAASTDWHLQAILALQQANLPKNISKSEAAQQGFVTVEHDLAILTQMNNNYGHQIAIDDEQLAGYALMMEREFGRSLPVLIPFFDCIDDIEWRGKKLKEYAYFVIGQLCVAKSFRGQQLSKKLYDEISKRLSSDFELMVTEISSRNIPSLKAHKTADFEEIHYFQDPNGEDWTIVARQI